MSIQENKFETFVKKGGYEIVEQIKRGARKGKFRHISKAAEVTGLSRPTIYKILEEHPEKPSKTQPKYITKIRESIAYDRMVQRYGKKLGKTHLQQNLRYMEICVGKLQYKDPMTWTEEDFRKLWFEPDFYSEECKGIAKHIGVKIRRIMRITDNHSLLDKFKYHAPPQGKRKQWFLHDQEIKDLVRVIDHLEPLMLLYVGDAVGARHQALTGITRKRIDFNDHTIQVYESKTQDWVTKYPPLCVFKLLKRYIEDMKLKPDQKVFSHEYDWHLKRLREAGIKANLPKEVSTHILKHTYVTQARRHKVSADVVVAMTGTELRTLDKYYTGKDEAKIRFEMQGVPDERKAFHEWYSELTYYFRARYEELQAKN